MALESGHLRGWKEIAAYLATSERSVKRWERERRLPVHRVEGRARDAVFARGDELDAWLDASRHHSVDAPALPAKKRWTEFRSTKLALLSCTLLAVLIAAFVWAGRLLTGPRRDVPARNAHAIRVASNNRTTTIGIQNGACGSIEIAPKAVVELCCSQDDRGLLVTVGPDGDGRHRPSTRLTVRLSPRTSVRIIKPVAFDLEWTGDDSPSSVQPR